MKNLILAAGLACSGIIPGVAFADTYQIDSRGGYAAINFRVPHLSYGWVTGRFDDFSGQFDWSATAPEQSSVQITIHTASIDSNNTPRDALLKSDALLDVSHFPAATFNSTSYHATTDNTGRLSGELTLHGVTHSISIALEKVGEGEDADGHYLAGFQGMTVLHLQDYGIHYGADPQSDSVMLELNIEGVRQSS